MAQYQKDGVGTREARNAPRSFGVWVTKPINGKEFQMALWESDQFIVVMKQGNACGAKGLAGEGRTLKTRVRDYGLRVNSQHIEGEEALPEEPCAGKPQARFCERVYGGL